MRRRDYRVFKEYCPLHVFSKAKEGGVIFYSVKDCLYYVTLYSILADKYKITVTSFCLMPNHVHSQERAESDELLRRFHCELNSTFAREYNKRHRRKGPLFLRPFGYAAKTVGKRIRENISYIANNPVVGGLCEDPLKYKWTLLAYCGNPAPYSAKIQLEKASARLRRSIRLCDYFICKKLPLDYARQDTLFSDLCQDERSQLTDYIVAKYNFLDYGLISSYFGGKFENALLAIRANSGSEYDMQEDFDDYSVYSKMISATQRLGYDMGNFCPESIPDDERIKLISCLSSTGARLGSIKKFLHLHTEAGG